MLPAIVLMWNRRRVMTDFKGKNNQGSREIFNSRLEYKAYAYAPEQGDAKLINFLPVGTVDFWWA